MKPTPQTIQQIERFLRKVGERFPQGNDPVFTDIHLQVKPSSGEILAFDDDDRELMRCVVEQWMGHADAFYTEAGRELARCLEHLRHEVVDRMAVLHPFSFVLLDEEGETLRDLYLVDDDTLILSQGLLEGLDEELDQFLRQLMKAE